MFLCVSNDLFSVMKWVLIFRWGPIAVMITLLFTIFFLIARNEDLRDHKLEKGAIQSLWVNDSQDSTRNLQEFFNGTHSIVLVHFDSGCDHCRYQANDFRKNLKLFADAKIIMLSTETWDAIWEFQKVMKLDSNNQIFLFQTNEATAKAIFGSPHFPHIMIYNKKGLLLKEFRGEVKATVIAEYL